MLLDAASLYFRAFYGVPKSITSPDGQPVNAIRGYLDFLATVMTRRSPSRLVSCLDADWRPAFRVAAIPEYKAHRLAADRTHEDVPEALVPQVPVLLDVLVALGLCTVGATGFEADDVIGTLAARETGPIDVVTGDRDLFQVIDDVRDVTVLYTAKGVRNAELVDDATLQRKYGVSASQYADYAILRGDPSDGLVGVKGIGEKTAAGLLGRFGSLDAIVEALAAGVDVPRSPALSAAADYLRAAPLVVRVRQDVPLPALAADVPPVPADPERLVELSDRWGLDAPLQRVLAAMASCQGADTAEPSTAE